MMGARDACEELERGLGDVPLVQQRKELRELRHLISRRDGSALSIQKSAARTRKIKPFGLDPLLPANLQNLSPSAQTASYPR